jgi:predicted MFS family arabinose efflux permease
VSFLAVIAALIALRLPPSVTPVHSQPVLHGLKEGFAYAFRRGPIAAVLLLLCLICLVGSPYSVLLPVIVAGVFDGKPETLGFLTAASGSGAFLGALYLAARRTIATQAHLIEFSAVLFGLSLVAFSFSSALWLSMLLLCVGGFGVMVMMASSNTVIQTLTSDEMRGRVVSYYVMSFLGIGPIGNLLAGAVATRIGATGTIRLGGLCCVAGALYFGSRWKKT